MDRMLQQRNPLRLTVAMQAAGTSGTCRGYTWSRTSSARAKTFLSVALAGNWCYRWKLVEELTEPVAEEEAFRFGTCSNGGLR